MTDIISFISVLFVRRYTLARSVVQGAKKNKVPDDVEKADSARDLASIEEAPATAVGHADPDAKAEPHHPVDGVDELKAV